MKNIISTIIFLHLYLDINLLFAHFVEYFLSYILIYFFSYFCSLFFLAVSSRFPVDEELKMLCMVDNIQRMGLAKHFEKEIEQILDQVYNNYQINNLKNNNEYLLSSEEEKTSDDLPDKLLKDSLVFRLLRLQGYKINQGTLYNLNLFHVKYIYLVRRKLFF